MRTSEKGVALIKRFEGFVPHAYDDRDPQHRPVKEGDKSRGVVTIGYGHTGRYAKPGNTLTEKEASALLTEELEKYERGVAAAIKRPMTQNQFDAFVSLCYNIGVAAFTDSTAVSRFNRGDAMGAGSAILMWDRDGGKVVAGLRRRRREELYLYLSQK